MKIAGKPEGEPTGRSTTASEGSVLDDNDGEPQVSTDDFRPIKIIGEPLSETIIRRATLARLIPANCEVSIYGL